MFVDEVTKWKSLAIISSLITVCSITLSLNVYFNKPYFNTAQSRNLNAESKVSLTCLQNLVGSFPPSSVNIDHLYPTLDTLEERTCSKRLFRECNETRPVINGMDTLFGEQHVMVKWPRNILTVDEICHGYQMLFETTAMFTYSNFLGVPVQQDPNDAFALMDLIWRLKPDLLIELGTAGGGSAFFYGMIMAAYNPDAHVITIDPARTYDWNKPGVEKVCPHCVYARDTAFWKDSGVIEFLNMPPADTIPIIRQRIEKWGSKVVLVMEDSDHTTSHVEENIRLFAPFVTQGSYLVVQDMKMTRIRSDKEVSPALAVKKFMASKRGQTNFVVDRTFEYYRYTQHAGGFLKRITPQRMRRGTD